LAIQDITALLNIWSWMTYFSNAGSFSTNQCTSKKHKLWQ
jgi:hypothetical protein